MSTTTEEWLIESDRYWRMWLDYENNPSKYNSKKKCDHCGFDDPRLDANFCEKCGYPLT